MQLYRRLTMLVLGLAALSASQAHSQPPEISVSSDRSQDADGVRMAIQGFARAFEKGDAATAVSFLSSGAELVGGENAAVIGREAIEAALVEHFADKPKTQFENVSQDFRFPSRDTAIVEGAMRIVHQDGGTTNTQIEIHCVRQDGKWLLSMIHEWEHEKAALLDMEWIIGSWKSNQADAEVVTTYQWFGNKAFIQATFNITKNGKTQSGMQMIGLDPETGDLKTWIFEANGGVGDGLVLQDGKQWIFESTTLLPSGDVLEATNILARVSRGTFTWQPLDLSMNGEQFGNLPPVKVTRVTTK